MIKAGFFARFVAYIIDSIILMVIISLLAFVFFSAIKMVQLNESSFDNNFFRLALVLFIGISYFIPFVYFGYFWGESGQTIGMKLAMVEVVRQDGRPLGFIRAGLRGTLGYYISNMFFGLGFIWAAIDSDKRAWHDFIFDTYVVDA